MLRLSIPAPHLPMRMWNRKGILGGTGGMLVMNPINNLWVSLHLPRNASPRWQNQPGGAEVPSLRNSSSSLRACSKIARLFSTCAFEMHRGGAILKTLP